MILLQKQIKQITVTDYVLTALVRLFKQLWFIRIHLDGTMLDYLDGTMLDYLDGTMLDYLDGTMLDYLDGTMLDYRSRLYLIT